MQIAMGRLQGYDFALLADPLTAATSTLDDLLSAVDQKLLAELQKVFWSFVKKHCKSVQPADWTTDSFRMKSDPTVNQSDVMLHTASLLFSLIPLHDPPHRITFYNMCKKVLSQV